MIYIVWYIKNQLGALSPIKVDPYENEDEGLQWYMLNKAEHRKKGVFLEVKMKEGLQK